MEYGLGQARTEVHALLPAGVLILLLMEYGRGHCDGNIYLLAL